LKEQQMEGVPFDTEMAFHNPSNPLARISEIAARLGVAPRERFDVATIIAEGADGKQYDVWEVAAAFLERMDKAI
jgi:hypothetical protein